jgi:hypothetical protein
VEGWLEKDTRMKINKIYISGPITGRANCNYPEFFRVEKLIEGIDGSRPVNPARHFKGVTTLPWTTYMKKDIAAILSCDGIAMMAEWESSVGAIIELIVALSIGLKVYSVWGDDIVEIEKPIRLLESINWITFLKHFGDRVK